MSFILESIKQAERERKLGQQAPSISIEYTSKHVSDVENNKLQWLLLAFGLVIVAIIVWGATSYFANKDRQYIEELSVGEININNVPAVKDEKRNIAMVPVKTLHSSNLKAVKVINDEEELVVESLPINSKSKLQQRTQVEEVVPVVSQDNTKKYDKNIQADLLKPSLSIKESIAVESKINDASDKQVLASIYSDLAELSEPEATPENTTVLKNEATENLLQIETASYIAPELPIAEIKREELVKPAVIPAPPVYKQQVNKQQAYKQQHEQAVSSGVPSFGELPYNIQEKIPDFNVSVHMFHADPLQRRIRINGQMYTEGKSLQQDLALLEITRYGAVFDYQGHKFRLNVR